jgi:hypothetical protein
MRVLVIMSLDGHNNNNNNNNNNGEQTDAFSNIPFRI